MLMMYQSPSASWYEGVHEVYCDNRLSLVNFNCSFVVIQNRIYRYRCQLLARSGINLSQILSVVNSISSSLPVTNRLMVILSYGVNSTEGLASLSDIRFMKRMSCESYRYLFASHVRIQLCVSL